MTHESIIAMNRAKFEVNRIVYINTGGIHTAYDVSPNDFTDLIKQLNDNKFTLRHHAEKDGYGTSDYFKEGDKGYFESYVITVKT